MCSARAEVSHRHEGSGQPNTKLCCLVTNNTQLQIYSITISGISKQLFILKLKKHQQICLETALGFPVEISWKEFGEFPL